MVRVYVVSVLRNLRRRRYLTALSRAISALAALTLAWRSWTAFDFWRALKRPHLSRVVDSLFRESLPEESEV
jgi:hypothetical protein